MTIDLTKHGEAILRGQGYARLAPIQKAACDALQAMWDEAFDAGALAMQEAAAKECNERGAYEQEDFGLVRATQNYFRARDAIRAIDPAGLREGV